MEGQCGLCSASYLVLHIVAVGSAQAPAATNTADLGNVVIRGFIHIFSLLTQYIIPVGFLIVPPRRPLNDGNRAAS